jgi:hypothetical protein
MKTLGIGGATARPGNGAAKYVTVPSLKSRVFADKN